VSLKGIEGLVLGEYFGEIMREAERLGEDVGSVVAGKLHLVGFSGALFYVDRELGIALGLKAGENAAELVVVPLVGYFEGGRTVGGDASITYGEYALVLAFP